MNQHIKYLNMKVHIKTKKEDNKSIYTRKRNEHLKNTLDNNITF